MTGARVVSVSARSRELIEAQVRPGARLQPARPRADGRFDVEVDEDVLQALEALDPDIDRAILRLCSTGVGHA